MAGVLPITGIVQLISSVGWVLLRILPYKTVPTLFNGIRLFAVFRRDSCRVLTLMLIGRAGFTDPYVVVCFSCIVFVAGLKGVPVFVDLLH